MIDEANLYICVKNSAFESTIAFILLDWWNPFSSLSYCSVWCSVAVFLSWARAKGKATTRLYYNLSFKLGRQLFCFLSLISCLATYCFLMRLLQSDESNGVGLHCWICSIEKGGISCFQRQEKVNSDHRHHWVLREKVNIHDKIIRMF